MAFHRPGDPGGEHVGRAHRHPEPVGHGDRGSGDEFRRAPLGVGEVVLADLLADGDDDPLPAEHRAEPEAQRHPPLHPFGNILDRLGELAGESLEDLPSILRDLVAELPHERPHRGPEFDKLRP